MVGTVTTQLAALLAALAGVAGPFGASAQTTPGTFLSDEDRPSPRFREIMAAAKPYLSLIEEGDGDGGRFLPAYVPDVQIEMKGSDAGRKQHKDCKNKTVKAIVNYVEAPTRISSYVGTLVDCAPTGMGLIRTSDGTVWAGQVRGYSEGKRPGLAIAAGDGVLKSGTRYRLGWMTGTPAQNFIATQQEAVTQMPTPVKRGSPAIWFAANPRAIIDLQGGETGPGQILLRSGAEFDGRYDGNVFAAEAKTIRYPERGLTLIRSTPFVGGISSGMPWAEYNSFSIKTSKTIGQLPAGTYQALTVGDRNRLTKIEQSSDGPRYLISGTHIEKLLKDRPQAFLPDIRRDPSMLMRAGGNVRNCRQIAFPPAYTVWWPGCVAQGQADSEGIMAFTETGGRMTWKRDAKTGQELFTLHIATGPRSISRSPKVQVIRLTAKSFVTDTQGQPIPAGDAEAYIYYPMGNPGSFRGHFAEGMPHGEGTCADGNEQMPCAFDHGVRTDPAYAAHYAEWRAAEDIRIAEQELKETERQAQLQRERYEAAEAAERRRIADENDRRRQEAQRRAERLAQMEEEADEPKRNYILEAIQEVGQKFQAAAVENQRGWDEVNRINRQTEDYNRRQREIVAQQQERNRQAAQERAAAASRSNAQISNQRREAEQRLAEARARAAQLRNEAAARPANSASTKPTAPASIGNAGQSMTAQTSSKSSGQPAMPAKSHPQVREATFLCLAHPTRGAGYYYCWGRQDNRRHLVGASEVGGWKTPESLNRIIGCPNGSGPRSVNDGGVYWACGVGADGRYNKDAIAAAQNDGNSVQLKVGTFYCSPGETACSRRTATAS